MPGRLFLETPFVTIAAWAGVSGDGYEAEPPRRNIQPGQDVVTLTDEGFQTMRWGIIPVGRVNARGRPVMETLINARSETLFDKSAFDGTRRAVVIVDGWYEWTGEKRRKTAWRIRGTAPLAFAAIFDVWRAPGGRDVPQVATVTCPPNADMAPIHHRMGVLLEQRDISIWLAGSDDEAATLCKPWPNGCLQIDEAKDVGWTAP